MCGIVGIAGVAPITGREWLIAGRDTLRHRGPDDSGLWWSPDGRVGLGHRRLAILDLSPAGHQPMVDAAGSVSIVFNGEIYNYLDVQGHLVSRGHAFTSHSDTEVILAAYLEWGVECLRHLNGMFALAIYDARQHTLFLARDRAGEKPLFYGVTGGTLRFASELKALLIDPSFDRRINAGALDAYLTMGYVPYGACIVEGVRKLPPAHALLFRLDGGPTRCWPYWQLPDPPTTAPAEVDGRRSLDEFESLLEDAVRRQLQADVPVGVLLSGGVDSSLVTAMAVRASNRVRTFTVSFPEFPQHDESAHARLIADHFGTEHLELQAGGATPDLLPRLARQYDEPMLDSSMIPTYLVSRLVRQYCTVALGGDGGDELFGGYSHYNRLLWTKERLGWLPRAPCRAAAFMARTLLPTGFKGRNWLQALGYDLNCGLPLIASVFDRSERQLLMRNATTHPWEAAGELMWRERVPEVADLLERVTRTDFGTYLPDDILVKVDRASMLNSLEVRAPLLDYRIIEFAFGRLPSRLKATASERKIFLKYLAAKVLPEQFDRQRKQGFSVPLAAWLRSGHWRSFFHEVLLDPQCLFDSRTVSRLFRGQERGRNNHERLFGLVLFELWRREYRMTL